MTSRSGKPTAKEVAMFEKILVCLDSSDLAEQVLPYAAEVARRFKSNLILLEVTATPSAVVEPTTGYYRAPSPEAVVRREDEANEYLAEVAARLESEGLDVKYLTQPGNPGRTIVSFAEDNGVGLIALATHGRSGLSRIAFGSVADFVMKSSGLPSLVIRPRPPMH